MEEKGKTKSLEVKLVGENQMRLNWYEGEEKKGSENFSSAEIIESYILLEYLYNF